MKIESIADNLHLVETIGKWHWDEWGHVDPEGNLEVWIAGIKERTNKNKIPTTYVALNESNELQGSVTLVDCDMDIRQDLWPWLAGLYVHPKYRKQGVGSALVQHAVQSVRSMGVEKLYLYTSTSKNLYQKLGWSVIDNNIFEGNEVAIMSI